MTSDEAKQPAIPADQDPAAVTDQIAEIPLEFPHVGRWLVGLLLSGVLLALKSGELAADAIVDGLKTGDTSGAQLGRWAPAFNVGVDRMRRLVCEYYAGFSFGKFVHKHPDLRGTVTDLLIGDLFDDRVDKVWAPMEAMYPDNRHKIPAWDAGTPVEAAP